MHHRHRYRNEAAPQQFGLNVEMNLSQAMPGQKVIVHGYGDLAEEQRRYLQSYGILPGRQLQVIAQRPVTIIKIEQTELAFEFSIAKEVKVEVS